MSLSYPPVFCSHGDERTRGRGRHARAVGRGGEEEIHEVGNADLDAHIDEDGHGAQHEVTERERAVLVLLRLGGLLLDGIRLGDRDHGEHDEGHGEDTHGDEQRGRSVADRRAGHVAHQITDQNRHDGGRDRVERTAELDQLVTPLAAAAEGVEHRIDHRIEHTHRETRDERADEVNREAAGHAREVLDTHADKTDRNGRQRRFLVADAVEHQTRRNTHEGVGDEIGRITQLRHPVRHRELVLHDHAQRIGEARDERDHREEREHHDDR